MVDNTIKAQPRTIRLKGVGTRMEYPVDAASSNILPGSLLTVTADGTVTTFTLGVTSAKKSATIFALENELFGKGIDDLYVQGDLVQAEHFKPGDWALALLAANAVAVTRGTYLVGVSDGTVCNVSVGSVDASEAIAIAMEDIDNSSGGTPARVTVAII